MLVWNMSETDDADMDPSRTAQSKGHFRRPLCAGQAKESGELSVLRFRSVCKWLYGQPREVVRQVPEPALL